MRSYLEVLVFLGKKIIRVMLKSWTKETHQGIYFTIGIKISLLPGLDGYPWSCRIKASFRIHHWEESKLQTMSVDRAICLPMKREDRTFWVTEGFCLLSCL